MYNNKLVCKSYTFIFFTSRFTYRSLIQSY